MIVVILLFGCVQPHKTHKEIALNVQETRIKGASDNDFLFWYVILCHNNTGGVYYYNYCSPTQVTNFQGANWSKSETLPYENEMVVSTSNEQVNTTELEPEIQTDINDNEGTFEGMSETEMGDYEGTSSDAATDNSSSESGSESSDGGDSGGGDGGGGE